MIENLQKLQYLVCKCRWPQYHFSKTFLWWFVSIILNLLVSRINVFEISSNQLVPRMNISKHIIRFDLNFSLKWSKICKNFNICCVDGHNTPLFQRFFMVVYIDFPTLLGLLRTRFWNAHSQIFNYKHLQFDECEIIFNYKGIRSLVFGHP